MVCPKCQSENVSVQVVTTGSKSKHNHRGCLWELGRLMLIICTMGLWLIVGRSAGKSKTKMKNTTTAVCQNCGNTWTV